MAIIMSNYSKFLVPVKKLQFPPWKTNQFENVKVYALVRTCPIMRGMSAPHVVMSVIAYVSTFFKLCMHIT